MFREMTGIFLYLIVSSFASEVIFVRSPRDSLGQNRLGNQRILHIFGRYTSVKLPSIEDQVYRWLKIKISNNKDKLKLAQRFFEPGTTSQPVQPTYRKINV